MLRRPDWSVLRPPSLMAVVTLALATAAQAQDPAPSTLDLELDRDVAPIEDPGNVDLGSGTALSFGPSVGHLRERNSAALRGLRRYRAAPGVLRFNFKGFSVLQLRAGGGGPGLRVQRLRDKRLHRPLISFTINKRF